MLSLKDLIKIIGLTIFFSVFIFIINYIFFTDQDLVLEEDYIDPSVGEILNKESREDILKNILKQKSQTLNSASKYYFLFVPSVFKDEISNISNGIKIILDNNSFYEKIIDLKVEFYKQRVDVRGKMKSRTVKIFGPQDMGKTESLAVFIHELGHFVDLYFLEKKVSIDLSNNFYNISWESTKTMRGQQDTSDFVSGYAMTNKYEDFAESFAYYVLHNLDFLEKTKSSLNLKKKYNFFNSYLFKQKDFFKTDFGLGTKVKSYYWDITKIDINTDKFLQYLRK